MTNLELKGKITTIGEVIEGTSKAGKAWSKKDFTISFTDGKFEKTVAFSVLGNKIEILNETKTGDHVKVSFNAESREWEGKYFTNLRAWKLEKTAAAKTSAEQPEAQQDLGMPDDLPF